MECISSALFINIALLKPVTLKKLFSTKYSDNAVSFSLLIMRLVYGGLLIPHGYQKLLRFGARSSSFADPFHIGPPLSMGLTIFAELFCATFIVLGMFTRLAAVPPIIAMSVAIFHAHNGDIFGQGEAATLFLAGFIGILFMGPGRYSLDKVIGK